MMVKKATEAIRMLRNVELEKMVINTVSIFHKTNIFKNESSLLLP